MNAKSIAAFALLFLGLAPAHATTLTATASSLGQWNCNLIEQARMQYGFSVTATRTDTNPAWYDALITWETRAFSDCDFFSQVFYRPGIFQVRGGAGVVGTQNITLFCPVQARNTTFGTNLGGPGFLYATDTSWCDQPCAPLLCHGPNDCDVNY